MQRHEGAVSVDTAGRFDVRNVTPEVASAVEDIGVSDDVVRPSTPYTKAALSTNENEGKLLQDGELDLGPRESVEFFNSAASANGRWASLSSSEQASRVPTGGSGTMTEENHA